MKILAFVGMPASGKGEAAAIAREMGYQVVNMGNVIREEVKLCGLEPIDENYGKIGTRLRQKEGPEAIARRCIPGLKAIDSGTAIVDGVRNIEEVHLFKKEFGDEFILINIDSSLEMRLARIRLRGRDDDIHMNRYTLRIRDERELGWGLDKAIINADMSIKNNGTLDEFKERIRTVIEAHR